jgi:N-acetyl-anhydromuramyl-L-alanine amidase AmpD
MRNINEIIVHCSATRPDWLTGKTTAQKVKEIKRWHVEDNKWKDIGYHFIIDRDGTVANGRDVETVGAHVADRNANTIGVCLIGGHGSNPTDNFDANFTADQDAALRDLIAELKTSHPTIGKVSGHNDYANKACPGFKAGEWFTGRPKSIAKSTTVQASAVQIVSGVGAGVAAVGSLDGTAQIVTIALIGLMVLSAAWIMRERIKKWAEGDR